MALPEERNGAGGPAVGTTGGQHRVQLRQPRIAEMIAAVLRERIVSGELGDGETLSKQDELLDEFDVSRPSLREALRILETEGLVTVRRGKVGGAVVHRPHAQAAAYMLGLVLQSQKVRTADLATALLELEPTCIGLCARRPDRASAVVPMLREALDRAERAIEAPEPMDFGMALVSFHQALTFHCGNESIILVVGALGSLWGIQDLAWPRGLSYESDEVTPALMKAALDHYRSILQAVEDGDATLAAERLRSLLDFSESSRNAKRRNPVIRASELRPRVELTDRSA